jgi:hypothetical protein
MPMAWHARPDHLAVQHAECREQGRGAVALVVVGRGSWCRRGSFHGQTGLGTIEGLDLALFIHAEDQRLVRRIEIEPDHVFHFGGEVLVAQDLERVEEMRLQSVRMPDALDAAVGEARRLRHAAHAPVGRMRRLLVQRHVHDLLDLLGRQWFDARWPGRVLAARPFPLPRSGGASDGPSAGSCPPPPQSLPPSAHRLPKARSALSKPPLGRVPVTDQPLQSFAISRADPNPLDFPHRGRLAGSRRFVNRLSATEH